MSDSRDSTVVATTLNQARRARRRGRHRKAMLLLRKAAFLEEQSAPLWNRYALSCVRDGRLEDAQKAFSQAIWLDRRAGNARRAEITTQLAQRASMGFVDAS